MTDHETETSTEIVWSGYQVDTPIDERIVMSPSPGDRPAESMWLNFSACRRAPSVSEHR